jgi:glycosyltransferase involved in cell wall biosynthesis
VRLLGVRHDIPQILAAADVFVLGSDSEALPIAVLEAMAAGIPVVTTDVGDLHTIVHDRLTGRLVPVGDAAAFAAAVIELLSDRERATTMGAEAQLRANDFTVQAMAAKYEQLYESCRTGHVAQAAVGIDSGCLSRLREHNESGKAKR